VSLFPLLYDDLLTLVVIFKIIFTPENRDKITQEMGKNKDV